MYEPPPHDARAELLQLLVPGIAHEINTPMQYIDNHVQFVSSVWQDVEMVVRAAIRMRDRATVGTPEYDELAAALEGFDADEFTRDVPAALNQCLDAVRRVAGIVQALTDFARLDGAAGSTVDVNRAVLTTLTVAHNELKYVAEVRTDLDAQQPHAAGTASAVSVALLNVLLPIARELTARRAEEPNRRELIVVRTRTSADTVDVSLERSCLASAAACASPAGRPGAAPVVVLALPIAA